MRADRAIAVALGAVAVLVTTVACIPPPTADPEVSPTSTEVPASSDPSIVAMSDQEREALVAELTDQLACDDVIVQADDVFRFAQMRGLICLFDDGTYVQARVYADQEDLRAAITDVTDVTPPSGYAFLRGPTWLLSAPSSRVAAIELPDSIEVDRAELLSFESAASFEERLRDYCVTSSTIAVEEALASRRGSSDAVSTYIGLEAIVERIVLDHSTELRSAADVDANRFYAALSRHLSDVKTYCGAHATDPPADPSG